MILPSRITRDCAQYGCCAWDSSSTITLGRESCCRPADWSISRPTLLGAPLKAGISQRGFEYSDCRVDDARLVVLNARDAADRGAVVRPGLEQSTPRARALSGPLTVEDTSTRTRETIRARTLVNTAGPCVKNVGQGHANRSHRQNPGNDAAPFVWQGPVTNVQSYHFAFGTAESPVVLRVSAARQSGRLFAFQ